MRRILLAEGHAPTREFVARSLSDAGFEVVAAERSAEAYELFASQRPAAVVIGSDLDEGPAALAQRLRAADPRVLVVVADKEHLGRARGLPALLAVKANAYVADATKKELVEKVQHLVAQAVAGHAPARGAPLVLSRAPAGRGAVKVGSIARTLHQIWRALSEGILVLEEGGKERRLFFLRASPLRAIPTTPPSRSSAGSPRTGGSTRRDGARRSRRWRAASRPGGPSSRRGCSSPASRSRRRSARTSAR